MASTQGLAQSVKVHRLDSVRPQAPKEWKRPSQGGASLVPVPVNVLDLGPAVLCQETLDQFGNSRRYGLRLGNAKLPPGDPTFHFEQVASGQFPGWLVAGSHPALAVRIPITHVPAATPSHNVPHG
jgi:hypothetical protein